MSKEKMPGWSYQDATDMGADDALLGSEALGTVRHAQSEWQKAQAAGDQAGMDHWHGVAEGERAKAGYSGGANGGGYIPLASTVKEPDYGEAPTEYKAAMDKAIQTLQGRGEFTYDPETDPSYKVYTDQYTRLGKQAMEDSYGHAALRTGGLGGSAAMSASQQAYNGYMQALADKIPELRQIAYQMYQDGEDRLRQDIDLFGSLDQQAWNRWNNDRTFRRGAFETDRAFDYNKGVDTWNMIRQMDRDAKTDAETEYQHGQDARSWAWQQDERDYTRQREAAELAAQSGDYSGYQALYGLTDEQAAALAAMSKQERELTIQSLELDNEYKRAQIGAANRSNRGSSGGSYRSGGALTAQSATAGDIYQAMMDSGDPLAYLQLNYKSLGVPYNQITSFYKGYQSWEAGQKQPTTPDQTGSWGSKLGDTLKDLALSMVDGSYAEKSEGSQSGGKGASYNSIWSRARTMFDQGQSEQDILDYLDQFSEQQLSDEGLEYIMSSLNLGGYRTGRR